jgi:membrane-bound lytic murein transglycosylase D
VNFAARREKLLHCRAAPVYPFFMIGARRLGRLGIVVFALAGAGSCASAPRASAAAPKAPEPSPEQQATTAATAEFEAGREAALAGDFACARLHFDAAVEILRPAAGPPPSTELEAFSFELYEGIQRYEALAGATEEAGTSHGEVSPELAAEIEAPEPTADEIAGARAALDAEMPQVRSDVPIVVNDSVLRLIAAFQSDALHDKIAAGLTRSGRYLPMIHSVFAEEGLPEDLAMIAFIESAFLPHARSPKAAHGIWQFMPRTGRQYGLTSNGIVDQRSDPEKATRAAARYLRYLHDLFDDWYLVMAAYNAGEGKILRAMQRTGARDFWELARTSAIRNQTKNYVPAFLASVLISKDPARFGFEYTPEPPLTYETLLLERSIDLQRLAESTGVTVEDLQALNPELRLLVTPRDPDGYALRIPAGSTETFRLAYATAPTAQPPAFKTHVARKGETLPRIARRYGVSVSAVASANSLSPRSRIVKGEEILIPEKVAIAKGSAHAKTAKTTKASKKSAAAAPQAVSAAASAKPKSYLVKAGDTLYRIAVRHGVSVAEILAINGLGGSPAIKPGDKLKIPPAK